MAAARERYVTILEAIEPAQAVCELLNRDIRDHMLFLGHDLNPAALAEIRTGVDTVVANGGDAALGIETALGAARSYLEVSTLPSTAPAAPTTKTRPAAPAGETGSSQQTTVRLDGNRGARR